MWACHSYSLTWEIRLRTKGHKWKQIRFAGALFSNLQDGKRSTYQERDLPLLIPEEKKEVTLATSRIRET